MRKNLITARKQKNYTQVKIASLLGITENHYQKLELGTSDGSVKIWKQLRDLLELPIDSLEENTA